MSRRRRWALVLAAGLLAATVLGVPLAGRAALGDIQWTSTTWSGTVHITGDFYLPPWATLSIAPGTTVHVAAHHDDRSAWFDDPTAADGFNDDDPTRLRSYTNTHTILQFSGRLLAVGTPEAPIRFTSDAAEPGLADWTGLVVMGKGSHLEHVEVEWTRHGLAVPAGHTDIVVRSTTVRHALWGCFSLAGSHSLYEYVHAEECGHEGFDIRGDPVIRNATVRASHSAVVVLGGSPVIEDSRFGRPVDILPGATPILRNVIVDPGLDCHDGQEWRYGDFAYRCRDEPAAPG